MLLVILIGAYLTYERPESAPMTEVADPEPSGLWRTLDLRTCIGAPTQSGEQRPAKNNTPIRKPGADVAGLSLSTACMRMPWRSLIST
ncbi:hypothetical protein [Pseudomonas aeruginosa]|uniref:hypothetical protein n=1 Tax=Pseudomonas aeruginosa TaxID=287 RepID=UPI002953DA1F|nr:hypothetical protein [Pseudomonas aeruginosa]MDV8063945.1 hypothetical protein [Pseudomonas aeruginosa]MDV8092129.1 hypothetical protein [Pseudomonas aeruginosa]